MSTVFPCLTTARLSLRQFTPQDVEHVYQGLSHPSVIRYYGVNFQTLADTENQMEWFRNLESSGTGIWWAIFSIDGATFVGAAGFNNLSREHHKAELGFWMLPEHWGKGYMTEALEAVIAHGLDKLQLHRIEAFVEEGNENSSRTLLKQKFEHEGTLRDYEIKNGHFISVHVFAKISADKHQFIKA